MKTAAAICLALVLTISVAIGCAFVVGTTYAAWQDVRAGERPLQLYEFLRVSHEGDVTIRIANTWSLHHEQVGDQYLDIDRQPLPEPPLSAPLPPASLDAVGDSLSFNRMGPKHRLIPIQNVAVGNWYFVFEDHPGGHARFELYDAGSRRLIGYLGAAGFQETRPDEADMFLIDGAAMANDYARVLVTHDRFQGGFDDSASSGVRTLIRVEDLTPITPSKVLLLANGSLFLIDLADRTVEQLLAAEPVLSFAAASRLQPAPDEDQSRGGQRFDELLLRSYLVVRTREKIILLHPNDGLRTELPLPEVLTDRPLELYLTSDGGAVLVTRGHESRQQLGPWIFSTDSDIYWVAPNGEVTRDETVTMHYQGSQASADALLPLLLPAPVLSLGISGILTPAFHQMVTQEPFAVTARKQLAGTWPMQLLVILISAGLAYAADRHRVNHRLPRSYTWLAFVFLFGLPGFLGYLLHRSWPVRHPAPPQPTGAEVFV